MPNSVEKSVPARPRLRLPKLISSGLITKFEPAKAKSQGGFSSTRISVKLDTIFIDRDWREPGIWSKMAVAAFVGESTIDVPMSIAA